MFIQPGPLRGQHVLLEPLELAHTAALQRAVADGESWKLWYASVPTPESMPEYVERAVQGMEQGNLAYAVRSLASGDIVGCTRYYDVDAANRRALIGYTWYADAARRTPVNSESKLLLLQHLFEDAGAIAVELRTHFFNQASRTAIERLGAKQDGVLRSHQILPDGSIRDTVVYSIVASEWPAVKNNLLSRLAG
ncbi:GNAT family N-acetyltransferase [Pseudomonas abyssi]|uniref:GNAT family N-acetyltransferase n=1 Tax=Pseudomonas abyssi TaxID=170540 RepID=UPI003C79ED22